MRLTFLDRIEEKYDSADVIVAPGGWCNCNCWCWCCSALLEAEAV